MELTEQQKIENRRASQRKVLNNPDNCLVCEYWQNGRFDEQGFVSDDSICYTCARGNTLFTKSLKLETALMAVSPCDSCVYFGFRHSHSKFCRGCGIPPLDADGEPIPGAYSNWGLATRFVNDFLEEESNGAEVHA